MDNKEFIDILIDKHINGSISKEEQIELDSFIKAQPELKEEIKLRTDITKGLAYVGNQELKSALEKIHMEEFSGKSNVRLFTLRRILSIAAVFVLGVLVFQFAFNKKWSGMEATEIYATHYKPYQASFQTRDEGVADMAVYNEAYTNGNYQAALDMITADLEEYSSEILLSAGISALEVGALARSRSLLLKIIERDDFYYQDHAKWYTGLSYLKEENILAAKEIFEELAKDPEADHHQEAKAVLAQMK